MAPAAAILPWVIGGAAVAGTAATIISSNQASASAKKAASEGNAQQLALEKQLADRQANVESQANSMATRDAARKRQLGAAVGATGRSNTILTSPLGDVGGSVGAGKTLLGS